MNEFLVYAALFFSILLSSVAQVFQKMAASRLVDNKLNTLCRSPHVWLSFLCLGVGLLLWLVVLSTMPVSQAYPIMSLGYIVVMLLARVFFKERIPARRWVGAALILLGVSCLMGVG